MPIIKKVPVYKTVVVREKVAVPKPGKFILKHEMEPFTKTLFNMVFLCYILTKI